MKILGFDIWLLWICKSTSRLLVKCLHITDGRYVLVALEVACRLFLWKYIVSLAGILHGDWVNRIPQEPIQYEAARIPGRNHSSHLRFVTELQAISLLIKNVAFIQKLQFVDSYTKLVTTCYRTYNILQYSIR